jgi:hypothetical protein
MTQPTSKEPEHSVNSAEAFEYLEVLTTECGRYTDPNYLAEMLRVYLHEEVQNLASYSRQALECLDLYFSQHAQATEYNTDHLMKEFIPALGAYLGQVVVEQLGGKWIVREPLMRSVVVVAERELRPFRHAYQCIYQGVSLTTFYEEAQRLNAI